MSGNDTSNHRYRILDEEEEENSKEDLTPRISSTAKIYEGNYVNRKDNGSSTIVNHDRHDNIKDDKKAFCVKRQTCGVKNVWCIRTFEDKCGVSLIVLATVLFIVSILSPRIVEKLIDWGIDKQTVLYGNKHGETYNTFIQSGENRGVKLLYSISYLNLTNPQQVLEGRMKPVLREVGPYIYREHRRKLNVTFSEDGDTVSFVLRKYYIWDEAANDGTGLSDVADLITTVHPVIQVLQSQLQTTLNAQLKDLISPAISWLKPLKRAIDREIDDSGIWKVAYKLVLCQGNPGGVTPFTRQSAKNIYWGYHEDPVLLAMQNLVQALERLAARVGKKVEVPVVPEAFPGLAANLTSDRETARRVGPNTVHTGAKNKDLLQYYAVFQNMTFVHACPDPTKGTPPSPEEMPACDVYQSEWDEAMALEHGYMPQWASATANKVHGTDGSMFPHPLYDAASIVTFQEDYRRFVELVYKEDVSDFRGVMLRRYVFKDEDFRNDSSLSADFYHDQLPTGLTNISKIGGFPLFLSKPHFLEADPTIQESVRGLQADESAHLTFIDVEPRSGVTFRTHKRVQLNAGLSTLNFPPMSRLAVQSFLTLMGIRASSEEEKCMREHVTWDFGPFLFLPMVWYDEGFEMPSSFVNTFKSQVYGSQNFAKNFQIIGPLVAGLCFMIGVVMMVRVRRREKKEREVQRESRVHYPFRSSGENKEDTFV